MDIPLIVLTLNLPILAVAALVVAAVCLLWLTWMDARKFLLPDIGNAILAVSALTFHGATGFFYMPWPLMIAGAVSGALIFFFARWYGFWSKKVEAVGLGDVKFASAAGLWLGPFGVGMMAMLSAFGLFFIGLAIVLIKRRSMDGFYVPFGVGAAPVTIVLIYLHVFYKPLEELFLYLP